MRSWVLLVLAGAVWASEPAYESLEGAHEATLGDRVRLPCSIRNLGDRAVMWRMKGTKDENGLLFVDEQVFTTDSRFSLIHDSEEQWDLVIAGVEAMDSRTYVCQISTTPSMNQHQLLNVKVPPRVNMMPDVSPTTAEPGETVVFTCFPGGNPLPTISWRRKGGLLQSGRAAQVGNRLELRDVGPSEGGEYECEADNGVGAPVRRSIQLQIFSNDSLSVPPWVEALATYIPVKAGTAEVNITCRYIAYPPPRVDWIRNGYKITRLGASEGAEVLARADDEYTLTILRIRDVRPEDFGDYICRVHNAKGDQEATIHLSGLPGEARVTGTADGSTVRLEFSLQTPEELDSYKIQYKRPDDDAWLSVTQDAKPSEQKNATLWAGAAKLSDLVASSEYLFQVSGRNRHGWGALPRAPLKLLTGGAGVSSSQASKTVKDAPMGSGSLGVGACGVLAAFLISALLC